MADGTSRVSASSISRLLAKKGFLRSKHGETEGFSVMHPQTGPSYEPDPTRVYIFYRASGPDESRHVETHFQCAVGSVRLHHVQHWVHDRN